MKKVRTVLLSVILVFCLFSLIACEKEKPEEEAERHFEEVYALAQEAGYTGTQEELIALFKGDSAYELACRAGYVGTAEEWLETLRGEKGDKGERGDRGQDGLTPYVGENGRWFVGDIDSGVLASGNGIKTIVKTAENGITDTYTITFCDETTTTFEVRNGENGKDGKSIDHFERTATAVDKDTYTIYFTDETTYDFDVDKVKGDVGNGIFGIEKTSSVGRVDTYTVSYTDGTESTFTVTNGEKGVGIKSVEKVRSDGIIDTYTILFDDGNAFSYTVANGKDGVSARDLYEESVLEGFEGDYLDFVEEYLKINADSSLVSSACFSSVSVLCKYQILVGYKKAMEISTTGSGVIYSMDNAGNAYIVTNYHVVFAADRVDPTTLTQKKGVADKIYVYLYGSEIYGSEYDESIPFRGMGIEAEFVGGSLTNDLAVLKITDSEILRDSDARPILIGDSDRLQPGETVYTIGAPGGEGIALSKGVVGIPSENISLTGADAVTGIRLNVIRLDATVNPGNSGGALINAVGELVGVVSAKKTQKDYENTGYAIPVNHVVSVIENILCYTEKAEEASSPYQKGFAYKPTLGITVTATSSFARFDENKGVVTTQEKITVLSVESGSIWFGRLKENDVLTSLSVKRDGTTTVYTLRRADDLGKILYDCREDDRITLTFLRGTIESSLAHLITVDDMEEIK